jgi:PAS domain S-box-containing protein
MEVQGRQILRHFLTGDFASQFSDSVRRAAAESAMPLAAAAAYYLGCLMGFALRFPSSGISFFWPPNAVLTTALLIIPSRRWPLLLATTFVAHAVAHLQDGIPVGALSIQYVGNAIQALLAAWSIRRFGGVPNFADLRRVTVFVVGACLMAPAIASVVPASVYVTLGWAPDFLDAWRARTVSNTVATLTLVPSLLILWWSWRHRPVVRPSRVAEFVSLLLGLLLADRAAAYTGRADLFALSMTLYAMTPVLLWATVRFGGAGLSFALTATVLIISNAAAQMSPAAGGVPADAIVGVQLLLTANAVPLMLLAGLLEQNRVEHRSLVELEEKTRESELALRETQHRYALAMSVGVVGVWDLDARTGIMHVEGTLRTALGYDDGDVGDTFDDWRAVIFEADREEVKTRLAALINGQTPTMEAEFRLTRKDGSPRWVGVRAGVTGWSEGKATRVTGTYADVTERKESTRALRQANERLIRVGRIAVIGEVTASIAHELSQPLTAITTNVLACLRLLDSGPTDDVREGLNDVLHDSRRASEILERTRRLFGPHSTQRTPVDMNAIVREVVKFAAPRLREFHVRVLVALDPDIPDVIADGVQMQQVLFNLVVNGTDAMNSVTGAQRHMCITTRKGKKHVVVSVRDSGTGLDPAHTTRVFEPFYTTKPGGSGLGLAISRSIVQSHGGTLWAVANRDRGSTFRFKIPIGRPAQD